LLLQTVHALIKLSHESVPPRALGII